MSMFTTAHQFSSDGSIPSTASYAFCKTHFSTVLPSILRSSIYSLSLALPHPNLARISVLHTCHMPRQSHPPWFSHPTNFWGVLLITTLLIIQLSALSSCSLPLSTSHPLSSPSSNTLSLRSARETDVRSSPTMTKESRTVHCHIAAEKPQSAHSHRTAVLFRRSVRHSDKMCKSQNRFLKTLFSGTHPDNLGLCTERNFLICGSQLLRFTSSGIWRRVFWSTFNDVLQKPYFQHQGR